VYLTIRERTPMMIKPGYKTSEFWFTLVSFVFSGLYLLGLIGDVAQKDELISNVSHAVESCILIGGQLLVLYKYINSRKEIKQAWWSTPNKEELVIENINNGDIKHEPNRSSKTRTRKSGKRKPNSTKRS
jgi:hypothetical protein